MRQDMQSKKQIFGKLLKAQVVGAATLWLLTLGSYKAYAAGTEWRFDYTGHEETWTVPEDGLYYFEVAGASGGGARGTSVALPSSANYVMYKWNANHTAKAYYGARVAYGIGGQGALATAQIRLEKGTVLYINVGQQGTLKQSNGSGGEATYNGGGAAGGPGAGAGGGASSVQKQSGTVANRQAMNNALIVAGGGGAYWSTPQAYKQALEYPDPGNINTAMYGFDVPSRYEVYYRGVQLGANLWQTWTGVGSNGSYYAAMWPGTRVENAGAVRAQISGSDIGAHFRMEDCYSGGGGGGYYGGTDGAIAEEVGQLPGLSYFAVDRLRSGYESADQTPGTNVNGSVQRASSGNGYVTIRKQTDTEQTLTVNLTGYAWANGKHEIVVHGKKGDTVTLPQVTWQLGYSLRGYSFNGTASGTLNGDFSGTTTYTFGWYDDTINLSSNSIGMTIQTNNHYNNGRIDYADATIKLFPNGNEKYFKVYAKKQYEPNYTELIDGTGIGDSVASWWNYGCSGYIQQFTAPYSGTFKFAMSGAGGGKWWWNSGGYHELAYNGSGGQGVIYKDLTKGETLYIAVGQAGLNAQTSPRWQWNGGGRGGIYQNWSGGTYGAGGGGATSIYTSLVGDGQLQNYQGQTGSIIAVVGGGAGCSAGESIPEGARVGQTAPNLPDSNGGSGAWEIQASGYGVKYGKDYNSTWNNNNPWFQGYVVWGQFGQGNTSQQVKNIDVGERDDLRRWGGAEPNPGGGGGYTGGWAVNSNGPGSDSNAGAGSQYINTNLINRVSSSGDGRSGNQSDGYVHVSCTNTFTDTSQLTVRLYDVDAPNTPDSLSHERQSSGTSVISWRTTLDNGTPYDILANRYNNSDCSVQHFVDQKQSTAYVETGVAKYIYRIDDSSTTQVNNSNKTGEVTTTRVGNIQNSNDGKWFHVAAVDWAGNVGGTAHIKLPSEFVIHYNKNAQAATGTMADQRIQSGTTGTIFENGFSRTKYKFINWTTKSDGSGDAYAPGDRLSYYDAVVTKNYGQQVTLYAHWEPIYTLYVKPNGGLWQGNHQITTFDMLKGDRLYIIDATRLGYNFKGWRINLGS